MSNENFKIANIGDSPKKTSGFAQVTRQLYQTQYEAGFQVSALGTMDLDYDTKRELSYVFWPSHMLDEMGHRTSYVFLKNIQPDLITLTYDPGNIDMFLEVILKMQDKGDIKKCPIVVYTPIEGYPVPASTVFTFMKVLETGGRVILYSPGMVDLVTNQYPELQGKLDWMYHGSDHANFRQYPTEIRTKLRKYVGLDDYFVVGSVGVNKRTKGFDYIIYTARYLKDMNMHHNIKFYLHTSKNKPTLLGYNLEDMAANYDVSEMILFKPEADLEHGGNINGIPRDGDISKFIDNISMPNTAEGRKQLFGLYSYIDRMNCLDCYLDLSQVEGWGLPPMEAMKCGVPTLMVEDYSIRSEIFQGGVMWITPEPFRKWTTWQTGAKLVLVDPAEVANTVLEFKDTETKDFWSETAIVQANKYSWKETGKKYIKIINEVLGL